jgi:hypothetical protein
MPPNSENLIMETSWYTNPGLPPSVLNNLTIWCFPIWEKLYSVWLSAAETSIEWTITFLCQWKMLLEEFHIWTIKNGTENLKSLTIHSHWGGGGPLLHKSNDIQNSLYNFLHSVLLIMLRYTHSHHHSILTHSQQCYTAIADMTEQTSHEIKWN